MSRPEPEYCEECEHPRDCPHCGELMHWHDFFGIHWCQDLYFGIALDKSIEADKLEQEGE